MVIDHKTEAGKGKFFVELDGHMLAEMVYTKPSPDKMIIEHTEVDESLKGKNVGLQLVRKAVEFARETNMKIIPLCPFANAVFRKTADFADVLEDHFKKS